MDTTEIIQTIDAEIARLEQARALLNGQTTASKRGRPVSSKPATTPGDSGQGIPGIRGFRGDSGHTDKKPGDIHDR